MQSVTESFHKKQLTSAELTLKIADIQDTDTQTNKQTLFYFSFAINAVQI